jgi:hypothetical protein
MPVYMVIVYTEKKKKRKLAYGEQKYAEAHDMRYYEEVV